MMQSCGVDAKKGADSAGAGASRVRAPAPTATRPGNQALLQRAARSSASLLQRQDAQDAEPQSKEPSLDDIVKYRCTTRFDPQKPQTQQFSDHERRIVASAIRTAQDTASQAYGKLANRDPHQLKLAERAFHTQVGFDVLDANVLKVKTALSGINVDRNVVMGTCDDAICSDKTIAYTPPPLTTVIICPFFFLLNAVSQAVTIIHEAGHMAVLDPNWKPGSETYCHDDGTIDCSDICPKPGQKPLENVDAWAQFIYCVSFS